MKLKHKLVLLFALSLVSLTAILSVVAIVSLTSTISAQNEIVLGLKYSEALHQIISTNNERVEVSIEQVGEASSILDKTEGGTHKIITTAAQILDGSKEQAEGIKMIGLAMTDLESGTSENSKAAAKVNVSTIKMEDQCKKLDEAVGSLESLILGQRSDQSSDALNSSLSDLRHENDDEKKSAA